MNNTVIGMSDRQCREDTDHVSHAFSCMKIFSCMYLSDLHSFPWQLLKSVSRWCGWVRVCSHARIHSKNHSKSAQIITHDWVQWEMCHFLSFPSRKPAIYHMWIITPWIGLISMWICSLSSADSLAKLSMFLMPTCRDEPTFGEKFSLDPISLIQTQISTIAL